MAYGLNKPSGAIDTIPGLGTQLSKSMNHAPTSAYHAPSYSAE